MEMWTGYVGLIELGLHGIQRSQYLKSQRISNRALVPFRPCTLTPWSIMRGVLGVSGAGDSVANRTVSNRSYNAVCDWRTVTEHTCFRNLTLGEAGSVMGGRKEEGRMTEARTASK